MSAAGSGAPTAPADLTGSFIEQFELAGNATGPLSGCTVAVKDLFDVAGHTTSFGSPAWLQAHPAPADATAPAVQALLDAGARVVGKTHLVEMAYSLDGVNPHFGTPRNPAAPGRLPGGSSSGSAAAVAAGQADIGLGSDTGGSVRVPASYCGLFGVRPTHGRIALDGARPLAPSYDTVGWFARDAALLARAAAALLPPASRRDLPSPPRWLVARDAFGAADPATTRALYDSLAGARFAQVLQVLGKPTEVDLAEGLTEEGLGTLTAWGEVFRVTQAWEVWQEHGAWVLSSKPSFGPGIQERFEVAAAITREQWQHATAQRERIRQHVTALLGSDGVLALPCAPGAAPLADAPLQELGVARLRLLQLTCIAGLAGLPQVAIPLAEVDGCPVGLGLVGPAGSDEALIALAASLTAL